MGDAMLQKSFIDESGHLANPLARRTDPQTSHAAAREYRDSGKLSESKAEVLDAVRNHGGCTAVELAAKAGLDRYETSRRLADLKNARLVRLGGSRVCEVNKRKMETWWAV